MKKQKQHIVYYTLGVSIIFALVAVFGMSLVTHNRKDSNVEISSASMAEAADLNNDNKVDVFDLSMLLAKWNTNDVLCDLNKDGSVNVFDLSMLLGRWGTVVVSPLNITPGAKLPITYSVSSMPGTKRYVATNGNDTTGTGAIDAPFATIKKAESIAVNGDTIIVRGGTYSIAANATTIDRSNLTIIAYPGETPIFDGSIAAPTTATTEGTFKFFSYQPMPAAIGEGVVLSHLPSATFSGTSPTGQAAERGWRCVTGSSTYTVPVAPTSTDPSGCGSNAAKVITGFFPDQVWVNGTALTQVLDKQYVGPGKFWVNRTSATDAAPAVTNLYMSATDAADMSNVRVSSSKGNFLVVTASDVLLSGFKVVNHSPIWSQYTLLLNNNRTVVENVVFDSSAATAIKISRGNTLSTLATGNTLKGVTVTRSGWAGTVLYYNDDTTLESVLYTNTEPHQEFYNSPQRGAIKITKSDRTRILNSAFENNGMGVWFDQSNYKADVVGSRFVDNRDSAVFYEISHGLTLVNNYINGNLSTAATVRLAGASGLKIVNNTIIGGREIIGIYTDARSKKYEYAPGDMRDCSEHKLRYGIAGDALKDCWVSFTSDFDVARPGAYSPTGAPNLTPGMTWFNSVDVLANNIIANPTSSGAGNCTSTTPVPICTVGFLNWNSSSGLIHQQVDLNKLYHPKTLLNGNIYQSTSGRIVHVRADTSPVQQGGFVAADLVGLKGTAGFGSTYYGLAVEANGLSGSSGLVDGQGLLAASISHTSAAAVPVDADINKYVQAGTKHYGIFR